MQRWDSTVLGWFVLTVAVFLVRDLWFNLETTWRIVSVLAGFTASFLILLNYHLRNAGHILAGKDKNVAKLTKAETTLAKELVEFDRRFRLSMVLLASGGVVYLASFLIAIPNVADSNQFFMYFVGWALLCLLVDFQIRAHLFSRFLQRLNPQLRNQKAKTKRSKAA